MPAGPEFRLRFSAPADGAGDVIPGTPLLLGFSENVDSRSVCAESLRLSSPIGPVDGVLRTADAMVSFTPRIPLAWDTPYSLHIGATVKGMSGLALSGPVSVGFCTRPLNWEAACTIQCAKIHLVNPQLAINTDGNAIAVWQRKGAKGYNIIAARYSAHARRWGIPAVIQKGTSDACAPQVAVDAAGNAIAIWPQSRGRTYVMTAAYFCARTGRWNVPDAIQTAAGDADSPHIAMNSSGDAVAIWKFSAVSSCSIIAACYHAATGAWGKPAALHSHGDRDCHSPCVAIDAQGNAVAVWTQEADYAECNVHAARYSAHTGSWSAARLIQKGAGHSLFPCVAMDAAGNAIAVWLQENAEFNYNVTAARYDAGTGAWGEPRIIQDGADDASTPQVAVDPQGNAIAVWSQKTGRSRQNIAAARYCAMADRWELHGRIQSQADNSFLPRVAVDGAGNAVAVWAQSNAYGNLKIIATRYRAGTDSWDVPADIHPGTCSAINPQIAVNASGIALVLWAESTTGEYCVGANRLSPGTMQRTRPRPDPDSGPLRS